MLWSYLPLCRHFFMWWVFGQLLLFEKFANFHQDVKSIIFEEIISFILHKKGFNHNSYWKCWKKFSCVGVLLMGWEGTCMTLKYISIQVLDIFMYLFLTQNNFLFLFSGKPKELMKINCVTWDISTWFKLGRVTKLIQVEMAFDASKLHF